jgi:hypothetical protein
MYVGNPSLKRLVAQWKPSENADLEQPYLFQWGDGSAATVGDYRAHELATHCFTFSKSGEMQKHMFPDIAAIVDFDKSLGDWVVQGSGVIRRALGLRDADASDSEIIDSVFNYPIIYKIQILRDS